VRLRLSQATSGAVTDPPLASRDVSRSFTVIPRQRRARRILSARFRIVTLGAPPAPSLLMGVDSDQPAVRVVGRAKDGMPIAGSVDAAVEDLFRRVEHRLGRFLAQLVRDRQLAEDLLQDTFHDALRSGSGLLEARSPEGWLFGIARNRALMSLRRRRRFDAALQRLSFRAAQQEAEIDVVAVRDLLERTLEPADRSLILLRYLHDFDAVELAEMTGLSADAVRQRLSRARKRLLATTTEDSEPREERR
jgi:RNA polymerase sigma factor (sigma-70 family)